MQGSPFSNTLRHSECWKTGCLLLMARSHLVGCSPGSLRLGVAIYQLDLGAAAVALRPALTPHRGTRQKCDSKHKPGKALAWHEMEQPLNSAAQGALDARVQLMSRAYDVLQLRSGARHSCQLDMRLARSTPSCGSQTTVAAAAHRLLGPIPGGCQAVWAEHLSRARALADSRLPRLRLLVPRVVRPAAQQAEKSYRSRTPAGAAHTKLS